MNHDELLELIAEAQKHQSELEDVEVKAAAGGTPKRLHETLSALANRPGGGVILLGLDESQSFKVTGVGNAHQLQEDISQLAAADMEPALRPEFTVKTVEGKTVVAVEIPEVRADQKPCYYKPAGLVKGSYIRVGNTDRQMTDYETFGYVSAHVQPTEDEQLVAEATIDDLDRPKLRSYIARLKSARPGASFLSQPLDKVLPQLKIARRVDGVLRPTLAGLLAFGKNPQFFEPQLVITYLQFYGTTETEKTPRGERFLDNKKFEGTIPEMIDAAVDYVMANVRKSSLIEGLYRRDIPEYPHEAVREAVTNALAHRDYSHFVRGSYVQIRLFADRLEIQSPGGLYGGVSVDTLETDQSTRNRTLMRLMEDLHLVENRGSGIKAMVEAMTKANLEPPRFEDKRLSFWVTCHNHTLMSPEAVSWLNQFAQHPLNDRQRLALVFMRHDDQITNRDYQRLNHVDPVVATKELRGLVQTGLAEQHGVRRWAYYTLNVPAEVEPTPTAQTDEEKIIAFVRQHGSITNAECQAALKVNQHRAWYLLNKLGTGGTLKAEGTKKGRKYVLP